MPATKTKRISLRGSIYFFSVTTVALSVVTLIPDYRLLELLSHFRFHYLIASLFFLFIFFYLKRYPMFFILSISSAINASFILPWYWSSDSAVTMSTKQSSTSVKLMHFNVLSSNTNYAKTMNFIEIENPDIVVLQEVNLAWKNALQKLTPNYPHNYVLAREDNFGISILSKTPLNTAQEKLWGGSTVPSLHVSLTIDQVHMNLITTHPLPPISADYYQLRNAQLASMMTEVSTIAGSIIVVGDLNITMWSSDYKIMSSSKLINARKGFGLLGTWPASFGVFGIPIDHLFVSDNLRVVSLRTGPNLGSDHLPIIAEILL